MGDLDALVFDLDGTLWDAAAAAARGWSEGARQRGIDRELTTNDIGRVCGLPFGRCVDVLFSDLSPAARAELAPHLHRAEERAVRLDGGRLYPGVADGLRRLSSLAPVLLLSNCDRWYLDVFIEQAGVGSLLHDTLCHGDTGHEKAENLRLLRERHGFERAAYVGDTDGDRQACEDASFEFVYAAYGFGDLDTTPAFESFGAVCTYLESRVGVPR